MTLFQIGRAWWGERGVERKEGAWSRWGRDEGGLKGGDWLARNEARSGVEDLSFREDVEQGVLFELTLLAEQPPVPSG